MQDAGSVPPARDLPSARAIFRSLSLRGSLFGISTMGEETVAVVLVAVM